MLNTNYIFCKRNHSNKMFFDPRVHNSQLNFKNFSPKKKSHIIKGVNIILLIKGM